MRNQTARTGKRTKAALPQQAADGALQGLRALIEKSLDDDKAENIVSYDLIGRSPLADYMIIATGQSARQVVAMAEHVAEKLDKAGRRYRMEGLAVGEWVLVDVGDIIIHLFRPETRALYQLEQLWSPEALGPPSA